MFQPLFLTTKRHLVRRIDANGFLAARMRLTEGVTSLTGTDRPPVVAVVTGEDAPLPGTAGFAGAWRTLHGVAAQRLGLSAEAVLYAPFGRARCTRAAGPLIEDLSQPLVERPIAWSEERTLHDAEGTFRVAVERIGGETPERSAVWGAVFSEPFDRETLERLCTELEGATLARRRATEGGVTGDFLWMRRPVPRSRTVRATSGAKPSRKWRRNFWPRARFGRRVYPSRSAEPKRWPRPNASPPFWRPTARASGRTTSGGRS